MKWKCIQCLSIHNEVCSEEKATPIGGTWSSAVEFLHQWILKSPAPLHMAILGILN